MTPDNPDDKAYKVTQHLLAIHEKCDAKITEMALDDWYLHSNKNYSLFQEKYKHIDELDKQSSKIKAMSKWCLEANIMYTPTIYINGYRLPDNYELKEIKTIFELPVLI